MPHAGGCMKKAVRRGFAKGSASTSTPSQSKTTRDGEKKRHERVVAAFMALLSSLLMTGSSGRGSRYRLRNRRAKHPRGLLARIHALNHKIRRHFVIRFRGKLEEITRGLRDLLMALHKIFQHLLRARHAIIFLDRSQLAILRIGARRIFAQRTNALCYLVGRRPE